MPHHQTPLSGGCLAFRIWLYGVVSPATCVDRLILRCTMGLHFAPGLLILSSAHTSKIVS